MNIKIKYVNEVKGRDINIQNIKDKIISIKP